MWTAARVAGPRSVLRCASRWPRTCAAPFPHALRPSPRTLSTASILCWSGRGVALPRAACGWRPGNSYTEAIGLEVGVRLDHGHTARDRIKVARVEGEK